MSIRNEKLRRFTDDLKGLIAEERDRCAPPLRGVVLMPMINLEAAEFVAERLERYLSGKFKTLDQAFSSGDKGRPIGSGKHLQDAMRAERLIEDGASITKIAKEQGIQRVEVKARRKRYASQIAAAKLVEKLRAKDAIRPNVNGRRSAKARLLIQE